MTPKKNKQDKRPEKGTGKHKKTEEEKATEELQEKLEQKLDALQTERDEIFEKLQRVSADYANFQKRAPRQIADTVSYEKEKIIKTILPALDNFEHTLLNADKSEDKEVLVKGVRIVYDQMLDILKSHGVERIKAMDQQFDPSLHQAMMQRSEEEKGNNVILEEFQAGYKLNDRIIRPSKVIVNKLESPEGAAKPLDEEDKTNEPEQPGKEQDQEE